MSDGTSLRDQERATAMRVILDRLVTFFQHDVSALSDEWARLTGEEADPEVELALANLRLTFSTHEITRAMRILAYRSGYRPGEDGQPAQITTWSIRQQLNEWRQDGRYGLED